MGACMSADQREKAARQQAIEKQLAAEDKLARQTVKLLLLGAGESGKSTFVKQMKIIHGDGYTSEELLSYRKTVVDNLVQSMAAILEGMHSLKINLEEQHRKKEVRIILECFHHMETDRTVLTPEIAAAVKELLKDTGVQEGLANSNKFQLNDSAKYYFNRVDEIAKPDYCPTQDDVLRSRVQTTGIVETQFRFKGMIFNVIDVGGQRSERRKWINCFDNVTAVLYCAALSGYDTMIRETADHEEKVNRIHESLELFEGICNNKFFADTAIILFLNKTDLFAEKIQTSNLSDYFPEYTGPPGEVKPAQDFILNMFLGKNKSSARTVYHHYTCATDTANVNKVFDSVSDIIIEKNLERIGFKKN
eukprot:m.165952 g.165952  ORF g.165952 m.165952 type:complete len:363 (-) comp12627_c0_seq1:81-1169(-)